VVTVVSVLLAKIALHYSVAGCPPADSVVEQQQFIASNSFFEPTQLISPISTTCAELSFLRVSNCSPPLDAVQNRGIAEPTHGH